MGLPAGCCWSVRLRASAGAVRISLPALTVPCVSTKSIGKSILVLRAICDEFERAENCRVEFHAPEQNVSDMLGMTRQLLEAQSSEVDVFDIDVIWPSMLGEHLDDLSHNPGFRPGDFIPSLIKINTVGRCLAAIPWYVDMAFLYVRIDLIAEAGTTVPRTLDDLDTVAGAFARLRAANGRGPWPLAMNLEPQEGLTCTSWSGSRPRRPGSP
jgi:trehalose/maltose transport system substrate-binding protein